MGDPGEIKFNQVRNLERCEVVIASLFRENSAGKLGYERLESEAAFRGDTANSLLV
jgi:hypothetical protein